MRTWNDEGIDKTRWGEGPWKTEPDGAHWREATTGLDCLIIRGPSGSFCGYVGVRMTSQYFGMGSDDVEEVIPRSVHGGLTFSDRAEGAHAVEDVKYKLWLLGFDCAHHRDFSPAHAATLRHVNVPRIPGQVYRDFGYVKQEVEHLAMQLSTPLEALASTGDHAEDPAEFNERTQDRIDELILLQPCCPHCATVKIGKVVEEAEDGMTALYRCGECGKDYSPDAPFPNWEGAGELARLQALE